VELKSRQVEEEKGEGKIRCDPVDSTG